MKNIINFSTGPGPSTPTVVQPDFIIAGKMPRVTLYPGGGTPCFRLEIGCQSMTVTAKTLEVLREEAEFPPEKSVTKKVIIKTGAKVTKSSARLSEESPSYYISEAGKIYPKTGHTTSSITYVEPRKYFMKSGQSSRACTGTGYWYSITANDLKNLKHILSVMNEYFNPTPVVPKTTKKKAAK